MSNGNESHFAQIAALTRKLRLALVEAAQTKGYGRIAKALLESPRPWDCYSSAANHLILAAMDLALGCVKARGGAFPGEDASVGMADAIRANAMWLRAVNLLERADELLAHAPPQP